MTRLWSTGTGGNAGVPITVISSKAAGDQRPQRLTWRGQNHQVAEITRAWRVDIDWWRERIWRTYFKLRTDTGLLVVVYQDLLSGDWYLARLYD